MQQEGDSMDHIIEKIWDYSEMERRNFLEEWFSGKYKKLSGCPNYYAVKAYCEAINALNKYCQVNYQPISPRNLVKNERWRRE